MTKIKLQTFPKIRVGSEIINQIAKELKITTETVRLSLRYKNLSPKAEAIRQRAKVILLAEAKKVDEIEIEK